MTTTRDLLRTAIERDLFGPDALSEVLLPPKYKAVRLLGRGGGGAVYLAEDTTLARPVAVKLLSGVGASDVERFRREARYAARLDDPAIVRVYETGDVEGQPYIAMQYVDGSDLDDARLDTPALVRVLRTVAAALARAHAAGIVHRDIKPQNILVDRHGRAYVTDFGIARSLLEPGATVSLAGEIIGTPALMSPEQARGDRAAVDARSDIYSLGATLYAKLTGRLPFDGESVVDVLHAVIHDAPPFPRAVAPSVPRSLEAVALRCMRKDPRDRYPSMQEVVDDLDLFLAGRPVRSESAAWFRRLVGAPAPPVEAGPDPHLATVLDVAREIAAWDAGLYRISTNICRTFPQLDAAVDRLDRVLAARPDYALARFHRGVALFRRGRLDAALEEMERAADAPGAQFELGRLYLALYLREHRGAHRHISRQGTREQLASARGRLEQAVVALHEAQRLGEAKLWQVDYARAVEKLDEPDACVAICDEVLARDPDIEQVWKLRGDALRLAGRDPFGSYDRALQVRRSYWEALCAKAEAHLERGQAAEARAALGRALELCPESPEAHVLMARVDRADAVAHLRRAAAIDPSHYEAAVAGADALIALGRFDEALAELDRAKSLDGCQNRVLLTRARALLGRGAKADLHAAMRLSLGESARVADNAPWVKLKREVEAALRRRRK